MQLVSMQLVSATEVQKEWEITGDETIYMIWMACVMLLGLIDLMDFAIPR